MSSLFGGWSVSCASCEVDGYGPIGKQKNYRFIFSHPMGPQTDKHLPPGPFIDKNFKKSRHLGFGVFIVIWSMLYPLSVSC